METPDDGGVCLKLVSKNTEPEPDKQKPGEECATPEMQTNGCTRSVKSSNTEKSEQRTLKQVKRNNTV